MSFEDFKANGSSEAGCRAAGKLRMEGRSYEVKDGDIMHVSTKFIRILLSSLSRRGLRHSKCRVDSFTVTVSGCLSLQLRQRAEQRQCNELLQCSP
jgi:hypothetical protein